MSMSFEKSVKGGTKIKLAPPKSKYVEHILRATHAGEAGVAEVFRTMTQRLRDSTWTIVFKGLIIVHMMIREGAPDVTLRYLSEHPNKLAISTFSDAQDQGRNIRHYYGYLERRARAYRDTKTDWVKDGPGILKKLSVEKGLLRETEIVQRQIAELLRCDLLTDPENEISLTAFRLLVMDLLRLFQVVNEGAMSILEHYFEMSKPDAERALSIYKAFAKQTDQVVQYLSVARTYEGATRLEIPKLKHAPVGLTQALSEYLNDPDFDINRRQYMAQKEAKRTGKPVKPVTSSTNGSANQSTSSPTSVAPTKGPASDLIDLFGSIENNQQTMATTSQMFAGAPQTFTQPQNAGTNPFAAMVQQQTAQQNPTGYNPFGPQVQPQAQPQIQMQTGIAQPFQTQPSQPVFPQQQQALPPQQQLFQTETNPFGQLQQQQPFQTGVAQSPFGQQQQLQQQQQQQQPQNQGMFGQLQQPIANGVIGLNNQTGSAAALQPQHTSTNPFRQSTLPQATGSPSPFNTGSPSSAQGVNPFRSQGLPSIQESAPFGQSSSPFGQAQQTQQAQQQSPFFTGQQQSSPFQSGSVPAQPLQPAATGTNPFARTASPANNTLSPQAAPLVPNPTGSTNPFRQSQFVNQQTGQGWQINQGTIGGLDANAFQSVPVFPRPPGQQQTQQQWP